MRRLENAPRQADGFFEVHAILGASADRGRLSDRPPCRCTDLTAAEARRALDSREISAVESTEAYLERIEQFDAELGVYLHVMRDAALAQAAAADRRLAAGDASAADRHPRRAQGRALHHRRTDHRRIAHSRGIPPTIRRDRRAARFASKARCFSGRPTPTSSRWARRTKTRRSTRCAIHGIPIGFPAGAAAARGGGRRRLAAVSLGSDTGGSIRQPAGFCGVVGLKPTYGRVSRLGLMAFASSLDQIGPFARTVEDAAITLQAIAGHDPQDSTSSREPVPDYRAALSGDISRHEDWRGRGIHRRRHGAGGRSRRGPSASSACRSLGAELVKVSLPHTEYALPTYYITAPAEASANLARYDGVKYGLAVEAPTLRETYERTRGEGFGAEVKRRIMLGTYALSSGYYDAYYVKAQKVRTLIKRDFDRGVGQGRRDRRADLTDRRVSARSADRRSVSNVPGRCLHDSGEHGRHPGRGRPMRIQRRPSGFASDPGTSRLPKQRFFASPTPMSVPRPGCPPAEPRRASQATEP